MNYSQSALHASPKKRQKLLAQVTAGHYQRGPGSPKVAVIVLLSISIVFLLLSVFMGPFAVIVAVIALILIPVLIRARKKMIANHAINTQKLEARYGHMFNVMSEIRELLVSPAEPVYYISAEDSEFYIVGPWFLEPNGKKVIHISGIAGIVGLMGQGTFLILDDGTTERVMFGPHQWGEVFNLFSAQNPYLLYSDDPVALPDGRVIDTAEAFSSNQFGAIVAEFERRKASA